MKVMKPKIINKKGERIWKGYLFPVDSLTPVAYPDTEVNNLTLSIHGQIDKNATTSGFTASGKTVWVEIHGEVHKVTKRRVNGLYRLIMRNHEEKRLNNQTVITDDHLYEYLAWQQMGKIVKALQNHKQLSLLKEGE